MVKGVVRNGDGCYCVQCGVFEKNTARFLTLLGCHLSVIELSMILDGCHVKRLLYDL